MNRIANSRFDAEIAAVDAAATAAGHSRLMSNLAAKHAVLYELIGARQFHYVDMPVYGNVGDLLIMHGTLAFFHAYGLTPKLTAPFYAYKPEWLDQNEVVVFQGGGNFGDLYAGMQQLRERVVAARPQNRIIILPQSIHFSSPAARARSAKIFRAHPDVHICVRDYISYESAREFSSHVYLLPDMAHQLYPVRGAGGSVDPGALFICRTDDESRFDPAGACKDVARITDWPELIGGRARNFRLFYLAVRALYKMGLGRAANKIFSPVWTFYSGRLIADAVALFSGYESIMTDRLHAHILACLMNKPNTVLDNTYGKNSRYIEAWTRPSGLVRLQTVAVQ